MVCVGCDLKVHPVTIPCWGHGCQPQDEAAQGPPTCSSTLPSIGHPELLWKICSSASPLQQYLSSDFLLVGLTESRLFLFFFFHVPLASLFAYLLSLICSSRWAFCYFYEMLLIICLKIQRLSKAVVFHKISLQRQKWIYLSSADYCKLLPVW